MKRVVKKFVRPDAGRIVPCPSSPPAPAACGIAPPRGIPPCAVDLSGLPPPDIATGWELVSPFIKTCYDFRCTNEKREIYYVKDLYAALFGKETAGEDWQILKARIAYHLQYLGFNHARKLDKLTSEVWTRYRAAWAALEDKKMSAISPVVKTFKKMAEAEMARKALPTPVAKPLPKGAVRIGGDAPVRKLAAPVKKTETAEKKATPKKREGKRVKFFDRVGAIKAVRWMFKNDIPREAVMKVCKKFGVVISESSANTLYRPGSKGYDGAKFSDAEAKQLKAAAK